MYFVAREIDSVTVFFISVMHVRESVVTADSSTVPDHPSGSRLMVPSGKGSALLLQFQGICLKQYGHFQKKARWCTFARECWQIISCLQDVGDEYRTIEAGASTHSPLWVWQWVMLADYLLSAGCRGRVQNHWGGCQHTFTAMSVAVSNVGRLSPVCRM